MRKTFLAIALAGACAALSGCIVAVDECFDGDTDCSGDFVRVCIHGDWEILEDCFALCRGVCVYEGVDPVCLC